jgi:hypothetical protein
MSPRLARILAFAAACGVVGYVAAHRRVAPQPSRIWPDQVLVHVPHLVGSITLDGDTDDPGWRGPLVRTGTFVASDGLTPVHPQSEARMLWGDGFLYLNLYAADEDIEVRGKPDALTDDEDAFHLVFTDEATERFIDINALGVVSDGIARRGGPVDRSWDSHLHVSHELDGLPNDPTKKDEEWALEVAIPFESLGLEGKPGETIGVSMRRCDILHDGGKRICGAWGEVGPHKVLVLDAP